MQSQTEPKTIGIDARMYGYAQTGIGNYIRHLLEYVFAADPVNHYVIFLMPEEFDSFVVPNERVRKVKADCRWYGWKEQVIFPFILYRERLDLMHFTHFNSPVLYFKRYLITIHDITPVYFPGHKMKSLLRRLAFRLVFFSSVKKARQVVAVSASTKRDVVKHFRMDPSRITVIYEGVDAQFRVIDDPAAIDGLKVRHGLSKPFLFYTGVWRNHKNLVGLIRAFHLIRTRYGLDLDLVLGGKEDPYYPEVRRTWEALGLANSIIPVGFIDQAELPLFYNAAEAYIIPSFYEGFGLVGLESMRCGKPVISSNRTSLPEILGDAAIYFDPADPEDMADKIHLVLTEKKLYNELMNEGFRQVEKYSWRRMGIELLSLYRRL